MALLNGRLMEWNAITFKDDFFFMILPTNGRNLMKLYDVGFSMFGRDFYNW